MRFPASSSPGGVETGGGQVVPLYGDPGAVRVEDGIGAAIPLVPAVSLLPGRMPPAGGPERIGSDGLPVSPGGAARGRILPFPAPTVRLPDAAATGPEASPVPQRPGLPDESSGTSAAGELALVRGIGQADRRRGAAAAGPETPLVPERLGLPDERLAPFATSATEELAPVRGIGQADRRRDAAAAGPEAPPAPERLERLPAEGRPVSSAAGVAGAPVPADGDPESADICGAARPLRLFAPPEPVEAVAEVPDGPPLRFRWRRRVHRVIRVEGPERIGGAWWTGEGRARDYFRVETEEGCRFWLFRTDPPKPESALSLPPPEAGDANGAGPRVPQSATTGTDAPASAFPRLNHDPDDCPVASASWEEVWASLGNRLGHAPQGGRPGTWFLHGVLG